MECFEPFKAQVHEGRLGRLAMDRRAPTSVLVSLPWAEDNSIKKGLGYRWADSHIVVPGSNPEFGAEE